MDGRGEEVEVAGEVAGEMTGEMAVGTAGVSTRR